MGECGPRDRENMERGAARCGRNTIRGAEGRSAPGALLLGGARRGRDPIRRAERSPTRQSRYGDGARSGLSN